MTREYLYEHVSGLKRVIRLLPIDELAACSQLRGVGAITFDDGYQSVLEEALPVFEALDVPFAIFVNTFPVTGRAFWRHKVMYVINLGLAKECEQFCRRVSRVPGQSFSAALKDPRNNTKAVEEEIERFLQDHGLRPSFAQHFLAGASDFVPHRLIWYGNHSHHHRVLASLSAREQMEEIQVTRNYLERIPGIQLSSCFALPFGQADQANHDTLAAVRESGYRALLLNRGGVNRRQASAMGVRVLERFTATEAPIAWNLLREVTHTATRHSRDRQGAVARFTPRPSALRILELVNSLDTGGAEKMASLLALRLQSMGHRVDVACLRGFGRMAVPAGRFAAGGIGLWECGKGDGLSLPCVWKLARFLQSERVDVIHSHNPLVTHYAAAASLLARTPLSVSTIHGTSTLDLPHAARALFAASCRATDRIVLVCPQVQQAFCRRFPALEARTAAIPNGIETDELLGIRPRTPNGRFVFGTIGRLVPVKDHHSLLAAFASVHQQSPECRLEILGWGELRDQLRQQAAALGLEHAVRFHGWGSDIPGFLARLDAFVLSSRSEGLPMTLLEAMAAGLPVVSTAVGGVPEIIEAGRCGWLARPGDPQDLARQMELALVTCDGHGQRGRSAVIERYSAQSMANRYAALFEAGLASKSACSATS